MKVRVMFASERAEYSEMHPEKELYEAEFEPEYYRPLEEFDLEEIEQYNGNHFIFGAWESLAQSDTWIPWVFDGSKNIRVSVTHILSKVDTQRFSSVSENLSNIPSPK